MEFNKNVPIYLQIIFEIKRRISVGALKPGDKLPSVRDFAQELQVNPNTIIRAYQEMERDGMAETRRGLGTFIVADEKFSVVGMRSSIGQQLTKEFIEKMLHVGVSKEEILALVEANLK